MITKTTTVGMTDEQWHAERRKSIGGSDAGTILGLNKYSSPYALWAEKTGRVTPEDISDREAVRLGHDLEDYVAKRFQRRPESGCGGKTTLSSTATIPSRTRCRTEW